MFKSFIKKNKQADPQHVTEQSQETKPSAYKNSAGNPVDVNALVAEITRYNQSKDSALLASIIEQLSNAIVSVLNPNVHIADIVQKTGLLDISAEQQQVFLQNSRYHVFDPAPADEQLLCNLALRRLISLGLVDKFFTSIGDNIDAYVKQCEHESFRTLAACCMNIQKQNVECHFAKIQHSAFDKELALLESQLHALSSPAGGVNERVEKCVQIVGQCIGHTDIFFELLQLENLKKIIDSGIPTTYAAEFPLVDVVKAEQQSVLKQIEEILDVMKLAGARVTPLQKLGPQSCGDLLQEKIYHTYLISHPTLFCALLLGASGVLENYPALHASVQRYFAGQPYAEAQFCARAAELVHTELKNSHVEFPYGEEMRALIDNRNIISKISNVQFMDYVLDLIEQVSQNGQPYLVCELVDALSISFQLAQLVPNYLRFHVGGNCEPKLKQIIAAAQNKITENLHVDEYNPALMLQLLHEGQLHVLYQVDHKGFCRSDSYLCCEGITKQIASELQNLQQSKLYMGHNTYQQLRVAFAVMWNAVLRKDLSFQQNLIPEGEFQSIVKYEHAQQEAVILESLFQMLSQCCAKGKIEPTHWRQILQVTKCVIASGAVDESGEEFIKIANMQELGKVENIEDFVQEVYRKKLFTKLVSQLLANQETVKLFYDRQSELRNVAQLKKFQELDLENVVIQEQEEAPVQMFDSAINVTDTLSADAVGSAINFDIPLITESTSSPSVVATPQEAPPSKLVHSQIQQSQTNDSIEPKIEAKQEAERLENAKEMPVVLTQVPQQEQQPVYSPAPVQSASVPEQKAVRIEEQRVQQPIAQQENLKVDNIDMQNSYAVPVRTIEISDSSSEDEEEMLTGGSPLQIDDQQNLEIVGEKSFHKIAAQSTENQQGNDFQIEEYAYPGYLENRLPFVNNNILVDEVDVETKLALFDQNTDTILSEVISDFYILAESEVPLTLTKEAGRSSFATPLPCAMPLSMKSKQAQFKENWASPIIQRQLGQMKTYIERVNKNYSVKYPSLCKWNDVVLSKQNKGRVCADCGCELQYVSEAKDFEDVDLSDDIEMKVVNQPVFCQYEGHWLCHKCSGGHAGFLCINPDNLDGKQVVVSARALGELYKYWYSRCYTTEKLKSMLQRDAQQAMLYQKAIQTCQACVDNCKNFTLTARRLVLRNEGELFEDELTMQEIMSSVFKNIWLKGDYEGLEKYQHIQDECTKTIAKAGGCILFDKQESEMGSITERKIQLLRLIFAHAAQCPQCRQTFFVCPECNQPMDLEDDESVVKFVIDFCCEHGLKECPGKRHRLLKHKCPKK